LKIKSHTSNISKVRTARSTDSLEHRERNIVEKKASEERKMISNKRASLVFFLIAITLASILITDSGNLVLASGKKKFLKGFILGALLSKSHYPM